MKPEPRPTTNRLANELSFHREIAPRAEVIWNWASPSGRRRAKRRAAFYVEALGSSSERVLELGCGSGVFLEPVVASGADVVAMDLSVELIEQARAKLKGGGRARFCCANAEHLPFADDAFEVVYGSSILHHLDLAVSVSEIRRVLRPGGRLVFAEPNLANPHIALTFRLLPRRWFGLSPDEQAFTRFRAMRVLRQAGFADVRSDPYDFLHPVVPAPLVGLVERLSLVLERLPLVREIAGSQIIRARKP